ncbi:STAS domain-containing protein [Cohnella rhizosphaerae]|uniref:STAS domain-containing protein n=1 Tax=Cohnella rhizosphaerae TaxID=1457232 RepID=A0A9X4KRR3_9BACL|nr:STAS domain-containing protein [Cohnella rhizosphaerae]MDG0809348.1 STAS domain-containing protein [Cohnella rhizosphaerae]
MNEELTIAERRFGTGLILDLAGNLTRQSEEALLGRRRWDEGLAEGRNLVLNFGGVRIVNSAGIALLIRLAHAGQKAGFRIYGIGVSGHYQKNVPADRPDGIHPALSRRIFAHAAPFRRRERRFVKKFVSPAPV